MLLSDLPKTEVKKAESIKKELDVLYQAIEKDSFDTLNELYPKFENKFINNLGIWYGRNTSRKFLPFNLVRKISIEGNTLRHYFVNDKHKIGRRKESLYLLNNEKINKKQAKKLIMEYNNLGGN